jgi:hypothetical protein
MAKPVISGKLLLLSACSLVLCGWDFPAVSAGGDAEPQLSELREQVQALQDRLAGLEDAISAPTTEEVDRVVARVWRDAESRSLLLAAEGFTGGFDKGKFVIRSADGSFSFRPGFHLQVRHITNYNDDPDQDDWEKGFEIRRMRLRFDGNLCSPDLTYNFLTETMRTSGEPVLLDAWVQYRFAEKFFVRIGQYKDGAYSEENVPDFKISAVERSMVNALIGGAQIDRVQGVMLGYDDKEHFRATLVLHDGLNSKNTDFRYKQGGSTLLPGGNNFGVSGRVEWSVVGGFDGADSYSALGTEKDLLLLGAGANWTQSGDSNLLLHTVDGRFENDAGLSLILAYYGLWRDIAAGTDSLPEGNTYDWGLMAQASWVFEEKWEVFGRYSVTFLDEDLTLSDSQTDLCELTAGFSHFFCDYNARLTIDVNWLPNGVPSNLSSLGYTTGDDDQIVLRAQFQIAM